MRVAYYTVEGSTLAWQRRLFDEGAQIKVYREDTLGRSVGKGIVPLETSRDAWLRWGLDDPSTVFFFDATSSDKFDCSPIVERLRAQGRFVVGGGEFADKLEKERAVGENIAREAGVLAPPSVPLTSVREAISYIKSVRTPVAGDGGFAWKSDRYLGASASFVGESDEVIRYLERVIIPKHGDRIKCIVQERIKGVALSTARWWNGLRFVGPFEGTIENKKFLAGNKGPSTGCAFNLVWFYREDAPKIARALRWDALEAAFRRAHAVPGLYDINTIVDRRGAWFLEWTPRLGIDSEPTSQRGITNLAEFLQRLARGAEVEDLFDTERAYMSVRLSVPPYPSEEREAAQKSPALGVPVHGLDGLWNRHFIAMGVARAKGGYEVADPYGLVGLSLAASTSLTRGFDAVYRYLDKGLDIPNLQYRTDAADVIAKDIKKMAASGWGTTDILEVD